MMLKNIREETIVPDKSSKKEEQPSEPKDESQLPSENTLGEKGIVILGERDIPFLEERPPNFSPHFSVTVHAIRKASKQEDQKE
jgi:hypothetical protein